MSTGKSLPQMIETTTVVDADETVVNDGGQPRRASILSLFTGRLLRAAFGSAAAPSLTFATDTAVGLFRAAANALGIATAGVERVRITSAGNVGIGTASPTTTLEVSTPNSAGGARITRTDTLSSILIHASAADPQVRFDRNGDTWSVGNDAGIFSIDRSSNVAGTGTGLYILNSGNVGIGTTSPASRLHIAGDDPVITLDDEGNASYIRGISGNIYYDTLSSARHHIFRQGTSELARITGAGNVGIGTASPSTSLHVVGPIRMGSYTVATVPAAATVGAGTIIYVSDETGGAIPAFSDGADWRRMSDRAVIA